MYMLYRRITIKGSKKNFFRRPQSFPTNFETSKGSDDPVMFKPAIRVRNVPGLHDRVNDILYTPPFNYGRSPIVDNKIVVFFGGDMQDFHENMVANEKSKEYAEWCLEKTAKLLSLHYKNCHIVVIRPSSIEEGIYSKYSNFVPSSNYGIPRYSPDHGSLHHLHKLIKNLQETLQNLEYNEIKSRMEQICKELKEEKYGLLVDEEYRINLEKCNIELVGFSKGCVVLNQFLHEFHNFNNDLGFENDWEINDLIRRIEVIRWLDGGHNGVQGTWITSEEILDTYAKMGKQTYVHVTPYQVCCKKRPWIGEEEGIFTKKLVEKEVNVSRKLHLENSNGTLEDHFNLLKEVFFYTP